MWSLLLGFMLRITAFRWIEGACAIWVMGEVCGDVVIVHGRGVGSLLGTANVSF